VFIYQNSPEFRDYGDYADLEHHETLEFLNCLGLNQEDSSDLLAVVLKQPPIAQRRQFQLTSQQEAEIRQRFFSGPW